MGHMLKVESLTGGYANKNVLHNISFHVNNAEIVGLIGLNGAGKSTTIKHIIGLLKEKNGSIEINGVTIDDYITAYRKKFAFIPEQPILYEELTLYEHLRLTAMAYDIDEATFEQRLKKLLTAFRMKRYIE